MMGAGKCTESVVDFAAMRDGIGSSATLVRKTTKTAASYSREKTALQQLSGQ